MAELVDALDLGSSAERRVGSTPIIRTINALARRTCKTQMQRYSAVNLASKPGAEITTVEGHPAGSSRRILVLTVDAAWPPISGAELRNWQNAEALSTLGEVLIASINPPLSTIQHDNANIQTRALTSPNEWATAPLLAARQTPIDVDIPEVVLPRLLAVVCDFKPDAIVVEGIPLFSLLVHLRPLTRLLVLDMHNIESVLAAQIASRKGRLALLWPPTARDAGRLHSMEKQALEIVDRVWVCAESDRQRLMAELGSKPLRIDIVPNAVPRSDRIPKTLITQPDKSEGWPTILLVGHLGYQPNVMAAERLAKAILPRVRSTFDTARLIVGGRAPRGSVRRLASLPNVELIPNPSDLAELFRRSHLTVVPLSAGGGTRIKVLEAMAWGLPVVATPLAVEGLDLAEGKEVLTGDSDAELADHVTALCADQAQFAAQRAYGLQAVTQRFGPSSVEAAVRRGLASPEAAT